MTQILDIFTCIFMVLLMLVILYKDRKMADEETKNKSWFKIYVIFMKIGIALCILLITEGLIGLNFYY